MVKVFHFNGTFNSFATASFMNIELTEINTKVKSQNQLKESSASSS